MERDKISFGLPGVGGGFVVGEGLTGAAAPGSSAGEGAELVLPAAEGPAEREHPESMAEAAAAKKVRLRMR